jgi:hypothetical protein
MDSGVLGQWQTPPMGERIAMAVGAIVGAAANAGICYSIHATLVRTFDMTVRKLAGGK